MKLIELSFENFRSFQQAEFTNFKKINFFIGQNGVGKSNIFKGLEILGQIFQDNFRPETSHYFDKKSDLNLLFKFTMELSDEERQQILQPLINIQDVSDFDIHEDDIFKQIKFEISFKDRVLQTQILSVTDSLGNFQDCAQLKIQDNKKYNIATRGIKQLFESRFSRKPPVSPINENANSNLTNTSQFISQFSTQLLDFLLLFFVHMAHIPNRRESERSQKALRVDGTSLTGGDLANELRTLSEDRQKYLDYENKINDISYGISEVTSVMENENHTIKIREKGLTNQINHEELSSGYHQTLILTKILQTINKNPILIEEPELHLNAKSQKKLMKIIREKSNDTQFFIETHSPIFTGVGDFESTFLISKDNGVANVLEIDENNTKHIKLELGITYADIFENDYLCFVEGSSEYEAFSIIAKKLGYRLGFEFKLWDLGGYGNVKNIKALLNYLKSSERKTFLLLDKNSEAEKIVENLIENDLIEKTMYQSLNKNFEDLFPSKLIIEKMNEIARDLQINFELSHTELEEARSSRVVDKILTEYWNKNVKKINDFPKRKLAIKMAESIPNEEIENNEFAKIVKGILNKFEIKSS